MILSSIISKIAAIKNQNEKFSSGVIQKGAPEIFR
jgi:hypothetical protein